jgi:hypothetical protein
VENFRFLEFCFVRPATAVLTLEVSNYTTLVRTKDMAVLGVRVLLRSLRVQGS